MGAGVVTLVAALAIATALIAQHHVIPGFELPIGVSSPMMISAISAGGVSLILLVILGIKRSRKGPASSEKPAPTQEARKASAPAAQQLRFRPGMRIRFVE